MIGWHWTGDANWGGIQGTGQMREYPLNKIEISSLLADDYGIFVFPDPPDDEFDELGCALFHALTKRTMSVVLLHVEYDEVDVKEPPHAVCDYTRGDTFEFTHNGSLGDGWIYHERKTMSVLRGPIPLERITLVKVYDIQDVLRHATEHALVNA